MNKILMIGGHGMLGRPVARRLLKEDFAIRVMARDPDKATKLLPSEAEVVQGDLQDLGSIKEAAVGCEVVYINLDSIHYKKGFRTELDGTINVLKALNDRRDVVIAKLSALGVKNTEGWWLDADHKAQTEEEIKNSGHPFIIFRPTWFMESLPLFINNNKLMMMGKPRYPLYWLAGDDYGRVVAEAFKKNKINRTFNVQGSTPITFQDAAVQFINEYNPALKISTVPLLFLKAAGLFSEKMKSLSRLMQFYQDHKEEPISEETWDELYKPRMTIKEYVEYMLRTGDIPSKR